MRVNSFLAAVSALLATPSIHGACSMHRMVAEDLQANPLSTILILPGGDHLPATTPFLKPCQTPGQLLAHHRKHLLRRRRGSTDTTTDGDAFDLEAVIADKVMVAEEQAANGFTESETEEGMPTETFSADGWYHRLRGLYAYHAAHEHARHTQASILEALEEMKGVKSVDVNRAANMIIVSADRTAIEAIHQHRDVLEVHSNRAFQVPLPTPDVEREVSVLNVMSQDHGDTFQGGDNAVRPSGVDAVEWNIAFIHADAVWAKAKNADDQGVWRGEGTLYANADTGVDWEHPVLRQNYAGLQEDGSVVHDYAWWDGVKERVTKKDGPCGVNVQHPCDDNGHGTHTISTTVGASGYGVAPGAKWISCRNMHNGLGTPATYLSCLDFFLAPTDLSGAAADPHRRPHVIGNSYGCPRSEGCAPRAFARIVEVLRAAGIFMAVSAGNDGPRCGTINAPPGYEPLVMSVAATGYKNMVATRFSSRGPAPAGVETNSTDRLVDPATPGFYQQIIKPDISAPGHRVRAAFPGGEFKSLSGTSMASPHIGGAVLLISAVCPKLARNVAEIDELIKRTSTPLYIQPSKGPFAPPMCGGDAKSTRPNHWYGYGELDVLQAVEACIAEENEGREGNAEAKVYY